MALPSSLCRLAELPRFSIEVTFWKRQQCVSITSFSIQKMRGHGGNLRSKFPLGLFISFLLGEVCTMCMCLCVCVSVFWGTGFVNGLKPYFILLLWLFLTYLYPPCSVFYTLYLCLVFFSENLPSGRLGARCITYDTLTSHRNVAFIPVLQMFH